MTNEAKSFLCVYSAALISALCLAASFWAGFMVAAGLVYWSFTLPGRTS